MVPGSKFRFPVSRADLARILGHIRVEIELDQESIAYAEFLSMAKTHPDLVPVGVEKVRFGFSIGGVSPVGHATPPVTLIDASLFRFDEVWAAAGHPNGVFRASPAELLYS